LKPSKDYENIYVQKIAEDSLQSSFIIWVKKEVKEHYHAEHTENIYVLSGRGQMTVGDSSYNIKKGDFITVLKGERHSVVKVHGRRPLKVLSIQSPRFDGADRIFVK
jgi:quercetin dioxygenase-like cupin family protein